VRLGYQHAMVSLDPHGHNEGVTGSVLSSVYEALVTHQPGVAIQPCLAKQWMTPDDTTWRFEIRDHVRFHDGRTMTVDDVVASLERAREDSGSTIATFLENIASVRSVEDAERTVEIRTSAPFPLLLTRLAMVAIVPRGFSPGRPIGTGPYRWMAGTTQGPVLLHRWEEYWGDKPPIEEVRVLFVSGEESLAELIAGGELDVMASVSEEYLARFGIGEGWRLERVPSAATTILGINVTRAPFSDPRVREALDLVIDRRALVAAAFPNMTAEPAVSIVPAEVFGFSAIGQGSVVDEARAKALVAEARPEGVRLQLVHSGGDEAVFHYLEAAFASLGFATEVVGIPYEELYQRIERSANDLYLFGWNFRFGDASDFLDAVAHSRDPGRLLGLLNGSGYSDAELDSWIERAGREPSTSKRLELLHWSLARLARDRPYLPLFHTSRLILVRDPFWIRASEISMSAGR
jgi:peptide/nickel transport system substrate-binding protein